MKRERAFPNTFAPACGNRELGASEAVAGLGFGVFKYRALPPKVRKAVDEEMERRRERRPVPWAAQSRRRAEALALAGELVRRGSEKGAAAAGGGSPGRPRGRHARAGPPPPTGQQDK